MSYREEVARAFALGKNKQEYPHIYAPLGKLQFLADAISDKVEWVKPVYLRLTDPDCYADPEVSITMKEHFRPLQNGSANIPCAMISFEIIYEGWICDQPVVHFFDARFLTVGVLLHELAHLHPSAHFDHGPGFRDAHDRLVRMWDTFLYAYGFVELDRRRAA